jgi:hypothetical protein
VAILPSVHSQVHFRRKLQSDATLKKRSIRAASQQRAVAERQPEKQKRMLELGRAAAPNANLRPTRDVKSLLELGPHDAGKDISL